MYMRCKISQFESDIKKNDGKKYFHGVLLTILAMVGRGSAAAYGEEATQWETKQKTSYFVWISTRLALTLQANHYLKVMLGIGTQEILIIALIILLLFGGKKIPELMRGLGKGVKSFKEGMNDLEEKSDKQGAPEKQEKDEASKE